MSDPTASSRSIVTIGCYALTIPLRNGVVDRSQRPELENYWGKSRYWYPVPRFSVGPWQPVGETDTTKSFPVTRKSPFPSMRCPDSDGLL